MLQRGKSTNVWSSSLKVPNRFQMFFTSILTERSRSIRSLSTLERCSAPWTTSVVPFTIPVFPCSLEQPSRRNVRVLTQWLPSSQGFLFTHGSTSQGFQRPPKNGWPGFHRLTAEGFKSTDSLNDHEQRFILRCQPIFIDINFEDDWSLGL